MQAYKVYKSLITNEFEFNKSVRGESESTYKKVMKKHQKITGRARRRNLTKITNYRAEAETVI